MSKAEQFIKDFTKHCINIIEGYDDAQNPVIDYYPWLTPEQALRAVEIAREELIDKACKYIQSHTKTLPELLNKYSTIQHCTLCKRDEFIKKLRKAMEE